MPAIKIEVQDRAVIAALNRLIQAGGELAPVLAAIGRQVKTNVQLGFVQGVDPYGRSWAPLKVRQGQPLRNTGRLTHSIDYRVAGDSVEIGTNVRYAPAHQFGATIRAKTPKGLIFPVPGGWVRKRQVTIPARPFLPTDGLPDAWREDILAILTDHLRQALRRGD